jgi:1-acyl-sn-glycerol-3-phosphate acyltransferase
MLSSLVSFVKAVVASVVLAVNTVIVFSVMIPFALLKLVLPFQAVRRVTDFVLNGLASFWIAVNGVWMAAVGRTRWHVSGLEGFSPRGWYLVSSNHQSWVDILVLQKIFRGRIPFLKFFIKRELIFVPVIGLAWWALDFPFMKRRGSGSAQKDKETARKACEKFKAIPTSVISFMEGTRFTQHKHGQQKSPYTHLLKPKTGGVCMALETMGELFDCLVDVTIVYPQGVPTFMDLLTGHIDEVVVTVRQRPIPKHLLLGPDGRPPERAQVQVQAWINGLWQAKDAEIAQLTAARRQA